jgi:hypothetical protein
LEEKNAKLIEDNLEKDLKNKLLKERLKCGPTDEKIFESKIL